MSYLSTTTAVLPENNPVSQVVVNGQTLVAGNPAITVSGAVISLQRGGSSIVTEG